MAEEHQVGSQEEAEERREDLDSPGKLPGESSAPQQAGGVEGDLGGDPDAEATGDGPSGGGDAGGADTGGTGSDSTATGDGPSGGATGGTEGSSGGGEATGAGGSGGAV